jgi:hypothetical protein
MNREDQIILDEMVCYEDFASWLIHMADEGGDWQYAIEKPWKYIDEFRNWLNREKAQSYEVDYE